MALVVVSNRLPVTVRQVPEGVTLAESVGGVATGLRGLQESSGGVWIGWPGPTDQLGAKLAGELDRRLKTLRCVPVHLSRSEVHGFYQGYSNGVIWPLFHYLIQQVPLRQRHWEEYDRVNHQFAEVVAGHCLPGDEVWVHDYQLMRVPFFLRRLQPEVRIGFFLHIPFPSFEVFRILPARHLLLQGLLGADLIGFHTAAYAEHFTAAVGRLLGVTVLEEGQLEYQGRTPRVGVFPMGIDVARFENRDGVGPFGGKSPSAVRKCLVAIDRLDYTKGIPRRLLAFEELLRRHPELREQVSLTQIAVPSRMGVKAYQRFRRHVDAMVGRINGIFGSPEWTPVQYLYRGFTQSEVIALYRAADVMLVTPVRDGMNLVAKEFVASRVDGDGVLVLSEFAGAAAELAEAVQVNPYDITESAEAYYRALTMRRHERRARMRALRERVQVNRVDRWAESFLGALRATAVPAAAMGTASPPEEVAVALRRARDATSLLLLVDYDGTLVPFAPAPELATPDAELIVLLGTLAARPGIQVHLISGRQRLVLETWFGDLPVGLHAEHGLWSRLPGCLEWERQGSLRPIPFREMHSLLQQFTELTPGSHIERKSASLAWHFRLAPADMANRSADALVDEARRRFPSDLVDILRGEKVVEIRPAGIHKGLIVARLLAGASPETLLLAVGDDVTDEDMFAAVPAPGLTVHVGPNASRAKIRLADVSACRAFLRGILEDQSAGAA
jgi:trehalose 6-phosphate synthase/phosphatase